MTVTADDVWAMRNCDDVTFYRHKDGETEIVVSLHDHTVYPNAGTADGRYDGRVYSKREQTVFNKRDALDRRARSIAVDSARLVNYRNTPEWSTEWSLYVSHVDTAQWSTIARSAKAGDSMEFMAYANNQSELLTEAGLVHDGLYLQFRDVARKNNRVFLICQSVGRDNSARMVHWH